MQQPDKKTSKKPWYKRWWAIALFIFVGLGAVGSVTPDEQKSSSQQNQQKTSQQTQADAQQAAAAKRQSVIDTYAAPYCQNHTNVQMRNDKVLTDGGWPTFDGKRDWTAEECKVIIAGLYDTGTSTERIASIAEGRKIGVGLRNVEVIYSLGYPDNINTTTNAGGTHEQWVYGNPIYGANYVYLDNSIVTSYQQ